MNLPYIDQLRAENEALSKRVAELERERPVMADSSAQDAEDYSTYPNPLNINFGYGRIAICKWDDKEARGVVLRDSGQSHAVGADCVMPDEPDHVPKQGEIYLRFKNIESAEVLHDILGEVIQEWGGSIQKLAQYEATKKVQDELAIATKERDAFKNALLSDWTENDAALTKAGISEHEGEEVLTVITRIEMLIAQRDALRTEAVEALEKYHADHFAYCTIRSSGTCNCGFTATLTSLRGKGNS